MHQIFYISLDPERAIGIEDLIPSYHILYSEGSQLAIPIANSGVNIKNFPKKHDEKINSTAKMLENPELKNYIQKHTHENPDILVFKNDETIENICKINNFHVINPSYKLGKELENKVNFTKFLDDIGVFEQPEYQLFEKFSELEYDNVTKKFGIEFIVQFIIGHTGSGTFFISSREQLDQLKSQYPLRKGKVSKKIDGFTYTANACITSVGVVIGGISEQITGIPDLTSSPGGTVGNDFSQRHLNDLLRTEIVTKTMEFAEILRAKGHKGIFGLDFIIEKNTNKIYLIEANIRQVSSSTFVSYIQRMNQIVPIMLWHALELVGFDFTHNFDSLSDVDEEWINNHITEFRLSNDKIGLNVKYNQPLNASQVLFRNTKPYPVQILDQFPSGIYRIRGRSPEDSSLLENDEKYISVYRLREDGWSTLCLEARGYNIMEAKTYEGFIVNTDPEKSIVETHGEIGRIQVLQSAFNTPEDKYVNGWMMDVINCVYENTRIIKAISK